MPISCEEVPWLKCRFINRFFVILKLFLLIKGWCGVWGWGRFSPISSEEVPLLECSVTLLFDFEEAPTYLDWQARAPASDGGMRVG